MKKISIIIACVILFIIILTVRVNAVDEACKISISADKTELKKGDTVILNGYIDTEWKIVIKTIERNTQFKSCCIGNGNFANHKNER